MRRAKKYKIKSSSEFELDLAPLLSVMVKLVPVLLLSSAFVQMMVIETQLPQVVQEAIKQQDLNPEKKTEIFVQADTEEFIIMVRSPKGDEDVRIAAKEGQIDYNELHQKLVLIKQKHPEVFKLELNPSEKFPYKEIVRIMDEARKSKDLNVRFPVMDQAQGKEVQTDYMFPEIVFGNALEG